MEENKCENSSVVIKLELIDLLHIEFVDGINLVQKPELEKGLHFGKIFRNIDPLKTEITLTEKREFFLNKVE